MLFNFLSKTIEQIGFASCYTLLCPKRQFAVTILRNWFQLSNHEFSYKGIMTYIAYIMAVTIYFAIRLRQKGKRRKTGESKEAPTVVFEHVSRLDADKSFGQLMKFLVNYGFYKFGFELTLCVFVIVIFTHDDIFVIPYLFWLVILVFRNREKAEPLWKTATLFVLALIITQCLIIIIIKAVHIIIKSCNINGTNEALELFYKAFKSLYERPDILVADFLLLMLMAMQV